MSSSYPYPPFFCESHGNHMVSINILEYHSLDKPAIDILTFFMHFVGLCVIFLTVYRHFSSYSAASSFTASIAAFISSIVLKLEKLKRTTPCFVVPSASCISGAQCAPALVAIP